LPQTPLSLIAVLQGHEVPFCQRKETYTKGEKDTTHLTLFGKADLSCLSRQASSSSQACKLLLFRSEMMQRKVDKWGPEEVRRWLANIGLESYVEVLRKHGINGPVHP
jgi:hypothetical protein